MAESRGVKGRRILLEYFLPVNKRQDFGRNAPSDPTIVYSYTEVCEGVKV